MPSRSKSEIAVRYVERMTAVGIVRIASYDLAPRSPYPTASRAIGEVPAAGGRGSNGMGDLVIGSCCIGQDMYD